MSEQTKTDTYSPTYSPAPEIPSWFAARLKALSGESLDGRPRFRVVWGMDARGFPYPDNSELKYVSPHDPTVGMACWILEELVKPEFFGDPDEWERGRWTWLDGKQVEVTAPYPHRGEYVMVQHLTAPDGSFMPLSDAVADHISYLVRISHQKPHNGFTNQRLITERMDKIKRWQEERRKETEALLAEQFDRHATTADETNASATREWSLPASLRAASVKLNTLIGAEK
jgi:hypothetical protein